LKKNWARLHSLVYVAALAGVIHFIWIQKSGVARPLPWIIWLAVVMGIRFYYATRKRLAAPRSTVTA
jgi:sulfoxide reductase heme-binding subunit YedZ